MKKYILLVAVALTISGCSHEADVEVSEPTAEGDWTSIQLVDVATGESFSVGHFEKPTLIQSFAVWCPSCKKQQDEMKILFEEVGDNIAFVSLDTDPNENEGNIKEHIEQYDFNWYYAISPVPLTQELIEIFGVTVVNAPSGPMILVCNGEAVFLESGTKEADTLKSHVEDKCN
jgi:thiol-disulfide isomerase/thioredoxin